MSNLIAPMAFLHESMGYMDKVSFEASLCCESIIDATTTLPD